jgi:hypothetical protein
MYYVCIAHRIHGAAIYGNMDPIIYHQYTPNVAARIQARTPQRRRSVRWPCCRSKFPAGPFRLECSPGLGGRCWENRGENQGEIAQTGSKLLDTMENIHKSGENRVLSRREAWNHRNHVQWCGLTF